MNPKSPYSLLDEISAEKVPQNLDLLPGVLAKIQAGGRPGRTAAGWLRPALLLLILLILAFLFSRPGVVQALRNLIGYIPEVGAVDQSAPLRVLSAPVAQTREAYTLVVDSAVLDSTRTVISYTMFGQFPTWEDPARRPALCQGGPALRLSDGAELAYTSSEGGPSGDVSQWRAVFPAVPVSENQVMFVLPCLPDLPAGESPRNWELSLAFAPAPADMTVFPVVAAPTLAPTQPGSPGVDTGMQLTIENTAALANGYYLEARLTWPPDAALSGVQLFADAVHVIDAAGQEVPVSFVDSIPPFEPAGSGALTLKLETGPLSVPGPARLVVDYAGMDRFASTRFSFDVGDDPRPGQTWEIDQEVEIEGQRLRVVSAEYIQAAPGDPAMLLLSLEAGPEILMVSAVDAEHEITGTGGSPNSAYTPLRAGWYYPDDFPGGVVTVEITRVTLRRAGPWSADWTPQ